MRVTMISIVSGAMGKALEDFEKTLGELKILGKIKIQLF